MDSLTPPPAGHNRPPIAEALTDAISGLDANLPAEFAAIITRSQEFRDMFTRVPDVLNDDTAKLASDQIAQITAHVKELESYREAAVAPVLKAQRVINGFFATHRDDIDEADKKRTPGIKQKLNARLTVYQQKKADEERLAREAEARRVAAAAAEAERQRQEAERIAREAVEAQERAARIEAARIAEEERKAQEAAAAAAKAIQDEQDLEKAIELEKAEKIARAERERIATERAAEAAKQAEAARIASEAEAEEARKRAARASADAAQANAAATAKAASMNTVRGNYGSSASLKTETKGFITDKDAMLGSAKELWPFLTEECLQKALNGLVKVHKAAIKIAGAEIKEVTSSAVRG